MVWGGELLTQLYGTTRTTRTTKPSRRKPMHRIPRSYSPLLAWDAPDVRIGSSRGNDDAAEYPGPAETRRVIGYDGARSRDPLRMIAIHFYLIAVPDRSGPALPKLAWPAYWPYSTGGRTQTTAFNLRSARRSHRPKPFSTMGVTSKAVWFLVHLSRRMKACVVDTPYLAASERTGVTSGAGVARRAVEAGARIDCDHRRGGRKR